MSRPVDAHLSFLHRLQQCCLRFCRRAIDLVGEHDVCKQRSRAETKVSRSGLEDVDARDVGGHQVRSELDPGEACMYRGGETAGQKGLRNARYTFNQNMAAGNKRYKEVFDGAVLSFNDFGDFGFQTN